MPHRKKHTMRWLRSILAVVLSCLLLCSLLCLYVLHVLERTVVETNTALTAYVQKSVDTRLEELHRYSTTIEITHANTLLKNLRELPGTLPAQAYQLSVTLRDFLVTNKLARGVYLYYPRTGLVVGNMGCFEAASYYALQGVPQREGYDAWLAELTKSHDTRFMLLQMPKDERLCYVREMRMTGEIAAVVVIEIDREELLRAFDAAGLPGDSATGVLLDGQLVAATGNMALLEDTPGLYAAWCADPQASPESGGSFAFFNASALPGLDYVSVYSARGLLRTVRFTLAVCVAGAVCCLAAGVAASVFISRRNAKPMEKLLAALGAQGSGAQDEYQFITNKIEQMMTEKYKSEELMQEHQTLLNGLFLSTVLRGGLHSENAIFAAAKRYEVSFEHPTYQVLVLAGTERSVPDAGPEPGLLHGTLAALGHEGLVSAYGGRYVVLLNAEECLPDSQAEALARALLDQAFPARPAHAGVGPCYDSMTDILTSYNCALLALRCEAPSARHPVNRYTPRLTRADCGDPGVMQAFSHRIYEKQFAQAQQLMERLYTEYLYAGAPAGTEAMRQSAVDNLLADALRAALPEARAAQEVRALTAAGPPHAQRRQAQHALAVLVQAAAPGAEDKEPVAVRAKRIIDENFADPMMGLYLVPEQLNVSNSYLSTTFKATYGVSIIQYINRLRVDQAKSLILNTDMNIKDIAQTVGFSSDINFIRVFKKLENRTPTTPGGKAAPTPAKAAASALFFYWRGRAPGLFAGKNGPAWPFLALHGKRKSLMQFILHEAFCALRGIIFPAAFSSSARSFAISSGMPIFAAGAAGGRAGGGGDIPAFFQKAAGAFCRGAAVVRFEQAGNVHPERTGHAVPAARAGDALGPLVDAHGPGERVLLGLCQRLEGRHRGKVVRKLFLAAHARKHHQHARQAGREADGPGRNAAAGRLRLQHRLGLRAQGSQRAAAHGLHHDARQAVFLQYFVLLPGALHGPVQIIQLQLGKIPRVGGAYRAQHGGLVVEREAQAADLPLGLFLRQKFKRADAPDLLEPFGVHRVAQVKIKIVHTAVGQLLVEHLLHILLRFQLPQRHLRCQVKRFPRIFSSAAPMNFFRAAAVVRIRHVKNR